MPRWAEEGKKLFTFPRNVYLSSSPAHGAEKKRFGWKFYGKKAAPSQAAAAVDSKRNSQLSKRKAKWTFTACSQTKYTVRLEDQYL